MFFGYPRPHQLMKGLAMAFAIVNKFNDNGRLRVSKVYGPFQNREEAQAYNDESFPSPELNDIVPIYTPAWLNMQAVTQ